MHSMRTQVDGVRHTAKDILIAVGGRPSKLDIPGAEFCITSDEILELPTQPKKVGFSKLSSSPGLGFCIVL